MSYTQNKFDRALARAEERAKHTDFDQHIIATDMGDFVVIDEGDGDMPQWQIDQIIYSVTGKLCVSDELNSAWDEDDWFDRADRDDDFVDIEDIIALEELKEQQRELNPD